MPDRLSLHSPAAPSSSALRLRPASRWVLLCMALLLAASCERDGGPSGPDPKVLELTVHPQIASISIGGEVSLSANVRVEGGASSAVTWSSSIDRVATVSSSGVVTGHEAGQVAIVATSVADPTKTDVAVVSVVDVSVVPATVVIEALYKSGTQIPIDPDAASGLIEARLSVVPGDQFVTRVDLLVDNLVVVSQVFNPLMLGSPAADFDPFALTMGFNTAAYDQQTGVPLFLNSSHILTARLSTLGGSGGSSTTELHFANPNALLALVSTSGNSAADGAGRLWMSGDLAVTVRPIIYTPGGLILASATVAYPGLQTITTGSDGRAVWSSAEPVASGGVAGYSNNGGLDPLAPIVVSSTLSGGIPGPSGPFANAAAVALRLDNRPPDPGILSLSDQGQQSSCCNLNWVGANYLFATGHSPMPGDGVGIEGVGVGPGMNSYHAGPASATNEQLAALPAATGAQNLAETVTNVSYSVVARVADRLGNTALVRLSPSLTNPLTTFGVDRGAPTILFNEALSVPANAINPLVLQFATVLSDSRSQFAPQPVMHRIVGNFNNAFCFLGGPACAPVPGGNAITIPAGSGSYFRYDAFVLDRAGNASVTISRTALLDTQAPEITSMPLPSSLVGGASTQFAVVAADNVDLRSVQHRLDFSGTNGPLASLPFSPGTTVSPFGAPIVTNQSVTVSIPFVRSLELTTAADAPSGQLQTALGTRFRVVDHAANVTNMAALFPAGSVPPGDGAPANTQTFRVTAPALPTIVCSGPPCGLLPTTVAVTAVASGPSGVFLNPFPNGVHFYWVDSGGLTRYIGQLSTPTSLADEAGIRRWTWTVEFNPSGFPTQAAVQIFAVGVDAQGDALRTRTITTLSLVTPG